jgi:hypothetical protein
VKACGRELSSQDIIDKVFEGLPPEFDSIIATLDAIEDADSQTSMTIAKVTELLQTRESQIAQSSTHFASFSKARLNKCKFHPFGNHSDARCFTQHPELIKNKHQQTSHYSSSNKSQSWHVDTACSSHMTHDRNLLSNFETIEGKVVLADKTTIPIHGRGNMKIELPNSENIACNAFFVPDLDKNLYSPGQATSEGLIFLIVDSRLIIYEDKHFSFPTGKILLEIPKGPDNLYRIPQSINQMSQQPLILTKLLLPVDRPKHHDKFGMRALDTRTWMTYCT